jgi:hypothetical protein
MKPGHQSRKLDTIGRVNLNEIHKLSMFGVKTDDEPGFVDVDIDAVHNDVLH